MIRSYDGALVIVSVIVAMLASYAALDFAGRVRAVSGATRLGWLAGGGTVMGLGIWSMHFVGMLALQLPVPVGYDVTLMLLSVLVAIAASFLALFVVTRPHLRLAALVPGGIIMGGAIAGMHYIGMASMRMKASQSYTASIVTLSVLIAIVASLAALWLAFRFRSDLTSRGRLLKALSAVVMGVAIAGMHYTGMAAAHFAPAVALAGSAHHMRTGVYLGGGVVVVAIVTILLALIGAVLDRSIQAGTAFTKQISNQTLELRNSEQRTRLILDNALDAVIAMDSSGTISDWNAQAERMFGWSRAEALGRRLSTTIIPTRFREGHERGLKKFLATGEGALLNRRIEMPALSRDGREFPVELAISPAKVGDEWTFSAFIRDLTERKTAEEALRHEEQRYRGLFENIPVGIYRSTPDGMFVDVNPAMVSMLGYPSREALLAAPIASLYADPYDQLAWDDKAKSGASVIDHDMRLLRSDGAVIEVSSTTNLTRDAGGTVIFADGVIEDVTSRLEAERALQASERRLIQILEAAPLGIFVSDEQGTPVFVNAAAEKILGKGVMPGSGVAELAATYKAYLAGTDNLYPPHRMPLVRTLTGERSAVHDMEIRQGDKVIALNVQGAPILDADGKVVAAVVAFVDNTDRKSLEAQLRQASKMEAVGQLAGGVAHDFNNLLTVIMSYSAMLLDRLGAGENREEVQEIAAAADRAAGLTRQLLAFSRQQVMQPRVVNLNDVIGALENMLRRIIGEDIQLEASLDPDISTINADPGQLEQVLMNLVVNARDAMPKGGRLNISTSNSQLSSESGGGALNATDGDYVMLAVSDTGAGMTREVQRRLFEPFFTTKEHGRGTGLGLSTVYGIVKQSGGEIYVYSEVGEGTTIKVYFPCFTQTADELRYEVKPKESPRGSETILLVEDDENLRSLVARVLMRSGYTVYVAGGGEEAIAIASDPEMVIDAVITDVVMPGMNGRELVEKLGVLRPEMGALLMSGYTDDDVLRRGVLHGETTFLQKPFTPEQLARKVREVLDRSILATVD